MTDYLNPNTFLNPLGKAADLAVGVALAPARAAEAALEALKSGAERTAVTGAGIGAGAARVALAPAAAGLADVGKGLSDVAGFLTVAVEDADKMVKKLLLGELVFAAVSVAGIAAMLWIARKPVAKVATKALKAAVL